MRQPLSPPHGSPVVVRRTGSQRFPTAAPPQLPPPPRAPGDNFTSIVTPQRSSTTPAPKSLLMAPTVDNRRGSAPAMSLLNPKPPRSSPLAHSSSTPEPAQADDNDAEPQEHDSSEPIVTPLQLPPPDLPAPPAPASTSPPPSPATHTPPPPQTTLPAVAVSAIPPPVAPISISAFLPPPVAAVKIPITKIPVNRPLGPTSPPSLTKSTTDVGAPTMSRLNTLLRTQSMAGPGFAPPTINSKGEIVSPSGGGTLGPRTGLDLRSVSMSADAPPQITAGSPRTIGPSLSNRELGSSLNLTSTLKPPLSHREVQDKGRSGSVIQRDPTLFGSAPLASLLPTPPPAPVDKPAPSHRSLVINELLKTERDYIADLDLVQTVFYKPLMERKILSPKDILALFSNVEQIKDVNRTLLKNIEECMKASPNLEDVLLGETFIRLADFLKVYTSYLLNQKVASDTMVRCEQQIPAFATFLKDCMADPRCRGLSFLSFLIKPTQRIAKYPLLLKELLKHTPEEHADHQSLQKALKRIEDIVTYLNERKRETENQQQILDIQSKLKAEKNDEGSLVSPGRRLVLDGALMLLTPDFKDSLPRRVYLFNDLLLAVKVEGSGKNEKYLVRGWFPLESIKVVNHADTDAHKNLFGIERGSDMLVFLCNGDEEKGKWLRAMRDLVKTFQKKAFKTGAATPKEP